MGPDLLRAPRPDPRRDRARRTGLPALAHDLARLAPDEREFPAEAFAKVLAEVARDGALLAYGSPFGYRPLRETLAARLQRRGIPADADALLIVNGAQQGLDLITRALVDPGDAVAVENPSYSGALSLLRAHGARLLGVPLDAEGPEPEALRAALAERPKFLYTIPDFQNPTGPPRHRGPPARARRRGGGGRSPRRGGRLRRRPLVEGELPPPLAALAPGHVVHLGTISKALFPGVRVGWISGPREFVHRLAALKRIGELTSPPVLQAALNVFVSRGDYDRHLLRVKARLRTRLALAHKTVLRTFPVGTRCDRPLGGWVLWVELPAGISGRALAEAARAEGVLVSPGGDYAPDRADTSAPPHLRRPQLGRRPREGPRERRRAGPGRRPKGAPPRPPRRGAARGSPHPDLKGTRAMSSSPVFSSPFTSDAFRVKVGLAEMLKGGVIMDVVNAEQAKVAEDAGASAVMALERVPSDIRRDGGVARMSPVAKIREIQEAVSIPVMAKCRIGHLAEARVLEALEVDFIDESEVLTPADEENHVYKHDYKVPFVCGCRNLGEALRRIGEGAAMIRTKGEAGTGDIVHAVKHLREVTRQMKALTLLSRDEWMAAAKQLGAPFELVVWVAANGRLPVPNFAAGGIATPADAALCRILGAEAVFVGSGIFKSDDPAAPRPRDRRGDDPLGRPGPRREGLRGPRRGDEGDRGGQARRVGAPSDPGLVTMPVGVLALQGDFEAHAAALARLGVAGAPRPDGGRGPRERRASSCREASRRRCGSSWRGPGSPRRSSRSRGAAIRSSPRARG